MKFYLVACLLLICGFANADCQLNSTLCDDGFACTTGICVGVDIEGADENGCFYLLDNSQCIVDQFSCTLCQCAPANPEARADGCIDIELDSRCPESTNECSEIKCIPDLAFALDNTTDSGCVEVGIDSVCENGCITGQCGDDFQCETSTNDELCNDDNECTLEFCSETGECVSDYGSTQGNDCGCNGQCLDGVCGSEIICAPQVQNLMFKGHYAGFITITNEPDSVTIDWDADGTLWTGKKFNIHIGFWRPSNKAKHYPFSFVLDEDSTSASFTIENCFSGCNEELYVSVRGRLHTNGQEVCDGNGNCVSPDANNRASAMMEGNEDHHGFKPKWASYGTYTTCCCEDPQTTSEYSYSESSYGESSSSTSGWW